MESDIRDDNKLPAERSGHVATQLNGKMIVWGGFGALSDESDRISEKYIASNILWIYNIEAQTWVQHFVDCPMTGQSGSGCFSFGGKLFVWGGYPHHSKQMFVLDPAVGIWQDAQVEGDPPEYRDKFVSWLYKDRYVIFGGFGPAPENATRESWVADPSSYHHNSVIRGWNNQLYEYNIRENRWSKPQTRGPVPCPRASHAGAIVENRGYVFGGRFQERRRNDIHFVDLDTYSWSDRLPVHGPQPEGRSWHSLTAVGSHHLLLCGGFNTACKPLDDAWMFDTNEFLWKRLEWDLPSPRLWHTAVQGTHLGEVVIFGGSTNNILSLEEPTRHTNSVLHIFVTPKPLFRICCDMIRENLERLRPQINQLPSYLQKKFDQNPMPR
ncbi:Kelch domain-containing protein 2 [Holothuria leucospilota]|uniref:Kelch domain-containing protein 2 n=1 Tax=Holothuria leucospilota TaxID=206669 RepID=A0A9Q1CFU6_HOLLE|nr:Kelch domain-containing protein 2 [Holothuria leucospilota]